MTINSLLNALLDKLPEKRRRELRQRILAVIADAHSEEINEVKGKIVSMKRIREKMRNG